MAIAAVAAAEAAKEDREIQGDLAATVDLEEPAV